MSYDICLEADLGGPEPVRVGYLDWNYTSNCAPMWGEAGADLAAFHGKPARECEPLLCDAIIRMRLHPEKYLAMNPKNGWGSYETLLPKLEALLEAFREAPDARVYVSR